MTAGRIRAGMGGWDYAPWRETFYPPQVAKSSQLHYASRQVTAIEVNGTFYRLQTPAVFAKWHDETPDDFMFAIKAPGFLTNRRVLINDAGVLERFLASGLTELKHKLGPILWQLAPTKVFDAAELAAFLRLLPPELGGRPLRHALEVRHDSFKTPEFIALAREHRIATVFADSDSYPSFADVTGEFVYSRLMRTVASQATGYSQPALAAWAERARTWAGGGEPADLPRVAPAGTAAAAREVFMFFISGAKERAPAAAQHLLELLGVQRAVSAVPQARAGTATASTAKRVTPPRKKRAVAKAARTPPAKASRAVKARTDKPGTTPRSSPRKRSRR